MFDARLFNQSSGIGSGFKDDECKSYHMGGKKERANVSRMVISSIQLVRQTIVQPDFLVDLSIPW